MKALTVRSLILISAVLVLAACQPTPEKPVVAQRDALEQSVESMPQQGGAYTAPETWQDEMIQPATGNKVEIDAAVVCPSFDSLDIMEIRPKNFTQKEVDRFIGYFTGNATLYNGEYQETKGDLEERIVETQRIIAMTPEERDAAFGGCTDEDLHKQLDDLQRRYAAAPEEAAKTPVTSKLTIDKDGFELLEAYTDNGGADDALIEVFNLVRESSNSASFSIRLRDESAGGALLPYGGTPEEIARQVLDGLGIEGAHLTRTSQAAASNEPGNTKKVTRLFYETTMKGIPIRPVCGRIDENEREYAAASWRPDSIGFDVGDNGLTSFSWREHGEIGETIKENVALLPFGDIMQRFESNIFMQPIWGYAEEGKPSEAYTYNITSAELCMVAVPQKDAQGEYLLVPAWNFYGYVDYTIPEELAHLPEERLKDMGFFDPEQRSECLMTLSAVDGALLHR